MIINTFTQAEQFLALHIPKSSTQTFPGELGLNRAKYFLHLLGDPQEKIKIIHVAGTSGKGSTCYLISSLLTAQGFKTGLHLSPHLTDVRERFQTSNQNISKKELVFYLNKIIPVINLVGKTFHGPLTYFEILVGMAFLIFSEKKVDYAVMETGLGGWYDATNVVSRSDKLSILTKIGLDHTDVLGKTIEKIALQKAMIINEKSQAISICQDSKAEKIIREVSKKKKGNLIFIKPLNKSAESVVGNQMGLIGDYQKENATLALTAVKYLSQRDGFVINKEKIKTAFSKAKFPGRFDVRKIANKIVIFDGAHNPQKMDSFISSLIKKYPNKKFTFLLAFKKGKDYKEMLKIIISLVATSKIILTSFYTRSQDMVNASEDPAEISSQLNRSGQFEIIPSLKKAWEQVLKKEDPIVVTGSLYLIGEIFRLIKTNK